MKRGLMISMLIGTAALALPGLAPASGLDATLLGELGAIGSYCSGLQGAHSGAEAYLSELTLQVGVETTGSPDFRGAYDLMSDALGRLGRSQGLALCGLDARAAGSRDNGRGGGR